MEVEDFRSEKGKTYAEWNAEKCGNSWKAKDKDSFYEEHRADIQIHEAAKRAFDESGLKSLPSVKTLNAQIEELSAQQKNQYEIYRAAREETREWQAIKQNIASMLGEAEKEKHHGLDRWWDAPKRSAREGVRVLPAGGTYISFHCLL